MQSTNQYLSHHHQSILACTLSASWTNIRPIRVKRTQCALNSIFLRFFKFRKGSRPFFWIKPKSENQFTDGNSKIPPFLKKWHDVTSSPLAGHLFCLWKFPLEISIILPPLLTVFWNSFKKMSGFWSIVYHFLSLINEAEMTSFCTYFENHMWLISNIKWTQCTPSKFVVF